jgi:NAD(P)H-hydrate epimerase
MAGGRPAAIAPADGCTWMEGRGQSRDAVDERYHSQPVLVLCGPGNNGGDGFVAARHLQAEGWPVKSPCSAAPATCAAMLPGPRDSGRARLRCHRSGLLEGRPLVIDALFGAGLTRRIEGVSLGLIEAIDRERLSVVAVDVPSGLHGDTGEVMGPRRAPSSR